MKSKYRLPIYLIAIVLLTSVIADIAWWIYTTTQYETFEDMKTLYLSVFPAPLQNAVMLTIFCIYFLAVATFIFIMSAKANYLKKLSVVLAGLSWLLLTWQVFSLM